MIGGKTRPVALLVICRQQVSDAKANNNNITVFRFFDRRPKTLVNKIQNVVELKIAVVLHFLSFVSLNVTASSNFSAERSTTVENLFELIFVSFFGTTKNQAVNIERSFLATLCINFQKRLQILADFSQFFGEEFSHEILEPCFQLGCFGISQENGDIPRKYKSIYQQTKIDNHKKFNFLGHAVPKKRQKLQNFFEKLVG